MQIPSNISPRSVDLKTFWRRFCPLAAYVCVSLFYSSIFAQQASTESRSEIRDYLAKAVKAKTVAGGSLIILRSGKQVFAEGYGYSDAKSKRTFEVTTPVIVASISKPILGTTLYRMVDQGKLKVDEPISKVLPEFSSCRLESGGNIERAPTITELLTHTSGMRFDAAKGGRIWYQDWVKDQPLEFVVKKVATDFPFKNQPGTKYNYSGIGTDVAARVGELVSGLPRNKLVQREFAEPLGLKNTFYATAEGVRERKFVMPTRYFTSSKSGKFSPSRKRTLAADGAYSPSGGSVISTAPDLATWLTMIRNKGQTESGKPYLSLDALARMLEKQPGSYNAKGGLFVRRRDQSGKPVKYAHTGSSGTYVWLDLEYDLICVSLTQTSGCKEFQKGLEAIIRKNFPISKK